MLRRRLLLTRRVSALLLCGAALAASLLPVQASASPISTTFGTITLGQPSDGALAPASLGTVGAPAGVRFVVRGFLSANADSTIKYFADDGLTVLPVLSLPCDTPGCPSTWAPPPSEAVAKVSTLISQFAARYGAGGSFWAANPSVPYHPVQEFQIGNEENIFGEWIIGGGTHLDWAPESHTTPDTEGPSDYAQVYEAARTALHQVDPSGIALVGGLADSAKLNVDVQADERYIAALTPGTVDAVGYHDWVFDVSSASMTTDQLTALEEQDPATLRAWMDTHGYSGVPISITEIGACNSAQGTTEGGSCPVSHTSAQWGSVTANVINWATCTPGMNVNNIDPFYWGDTAATASNVWLPLVENGAATPYGQDVLATTSTLTATGCPDVSPAKPANITPPSINGVFVAGQTVTGSSGQWTGDPPLAYQWLRCDAAGGDCDSIGDTGLSYTIASTDAGTRLQLLVTAINSGGVSAASSVLSPIVVPAESSGSSATAAPAPAPPGASGPMVTPTVPSSTSTVPRRREAKPAKLSMRVRVVKVTRRGHSVTVKVRYVKKSGTLAATATEVVKKHAKARHRRLKRHRENSTTTTFTGRLPLGAWVISVTGKPAEGFRAPKKVRRTIRIKSP